MKRRSFFAAIFSAPVATTSSRPKSPWTEMKSAATARDEILKDMQIHAEIMRKTILFPTKP